MKILVTGVGGQVGNALLKTLAPFGALIPVDVAPTNPTTPGLRLVDFTDLGALRQIVRDIGPNLIVNPAAYTAVDKAESEEPKAHAVNAEAASILAEEAARLGAPMIHYSTDYVFAGDGTRPWRETDPTGPLGAYGRTKLAGEQAVVKLAKQHVILRTSWVFSAHGQNFVKTMLRLGAERAELRVVADQFGAPTAAQTLAEMTARVIDIGLQRGFADITGLYHLANAGETSWHGFATEIFRQARAAGIPLKIERVDAIKTSDYPTPAKRPANSRFDCGKFVRTFDRQIPTWQDALRPVIAALASARP